MPIKRVKKEKKFRGTLKGNSGFIGGGIHLAADYGTDEDTCFVRVGTDSWKRVKKSKVKDKSTIIRCWKCNTYASTLSHYYPYIPDGTVCVKHMDKR